MNLPIDWVSRPSTSGVSLVLSRMRACLSYRLLSLPNLPPTSSKRSDQMNERLPTYNPSPSSSIFPVPSMRRASWDMNYQGTASTSPSPNSSPSPYGAGGPNIEELIRSVLEEDDRGEHGGVVERLAERIARGRGVTGKHRPLKRYETAL